MSGIGAAHVMKRIPRIKFPNRRAQSSTGSGSQPLSGSDATQKTVSKSEIQFAPANPSVGGKASLQPKRTPVSEREIEAIMLGGCI